MSYKISKGFWQNVKRYPDYPNTKQRRLIDVNFIVSNVTNLNSVLDLGCADGYLLIALREFTDAKKFYGYDISENLLHKLGLRWGKVKGLELKVCDFTNNTNYPQVDLTLSMGLFPYIFDYTDLYNIIANIKSNKFIVRAPCTVKDQDDYINTYSEDLLSNYSSIYRTTQSYLSILRIFYTNIYIEKAYPNEIESKYGTKQFFFVCEGRQV